MISMVESATRSRTPNEIALSVLLVFLTCVFLLAVGTLRPIAQLSEKLAGQSGVINVSLVVLVCLTVCLIPTTIGALLSAIGISGIDRMIQRNVLAYFGPRRRSRGRHRRPAARQNRHDHDGQPPGRRFHSRAGRRGKRAREGGAVGVDGG
jgi:hypothetical protein